MAMKPRRRLALILSGVILAGGLITSAPFIYAGQACEGRNDNKELIRALLGEFGGPQVISDPDVRRTVVERLQPEDCWTLLS